MATKVTIQDIASELQLSRNTVSKAINNTGVLADATREKILRKAAEMGYKQFAYLPLFQEDAAKAAAPEACLPAPNAPGSPHDDLPAECRNDPAAGCTLPPYKGC